tara:strand:+ start:260 stop:967 length:708 start_codon:yes stop_codon:yes gene_type:complete
MYSNSFSVVIPIYNESLNIINLIEEILINLSRFKKFEVIIVDDHSSDKSLDKINQKFNNNHLIKTFRNKKNIGQSFSIIKGCELSKYQTIVTLDGDGQNDPKDIPKLLKIYFERNDLFLVSGIRTSRKDNYIKKITSRLANFIRAIILDDNCIDTGCALKVFNKETFLMFPKFDGLHRFIPAFFKFHNKKMAFISVAHRKRKFGKSNYDTFKRAIKGLKDTIRVYNITKNKNEFR